MRAAAGSSAAPLLPKFMVLTSRDWNNCGLQVGSRKASLGSGQRHSWGQHGVWVRLPGSPHCGCLPQPLVLVGSGAGSAVPGLHWHSISSGPALSPPLPSAEAPAALACSSELKAKPAVENAALTRWGLIPVSGGCAAPTTTSRAWGCAGHGPALPENHASTSAGNVRAPRAGEGGRCVSVPVLMWDCGCARVFLGHVADAHECPRGGFMELLIHVAIGHSDPRCGVCSLARVMAPEPG